MSIHNSPRKLLFSTLDCRNKVISPHHHSTWNVNVNPCKINWPERGVPSRCRSVGLLSKKSAISHNHSHELRVACNCCMSTYYFRPIFASSGSQSQMRYLRQRRHVSRDVCRRCNGFVTIAVWTVSVITQILISVIVTSIITYMENRCTRDWRIVKWDVCTLELFSM